MRGTEQWVAMAGIDLTLYADRLDSALPFTVITVPKSARSLKRSRELVPHEFLVCDHL
jgi:hypothetical protein